VQPVDYGQSAVSSPITSACAACHDSKPAVAHMKGNGGVWYQQRKDVPTLSGVQGASIVLQSNEQCLICHGNGKVADIRAVHMNWQ